MTAKFYLVPIMALLFLVGMGSPSVAACGYQGSYLPPGLYHERPPYFSYFRPVYYRMNNNDYPTARPARRTQSPAPKPLRIINPYVKVDWVKKDVDDSSQIQPLRIKNPYVDSQKAGK